MNELVRRWTVLADLLESGDDSACLQALREWIEEWDRRFWAEDFSGFEAIYAPDFVGVNRVPLSPVSDVNGPAGFVGLRADIADAASRFWFDITGFRGGPGGRFAGLGRMRARGRYTGLVVQAPWAVVWTVRDRALVGAEAYMSHRRALQELTEPSPAVV